MSQQTSNALDKAAPPQSPIDFATVLLPPHPKLSRMFRLQYEPVQKAWVLLYPEGMVKLNDSAAEILRRCTGKLSLQAIVAELEVLFSVKDIETQVKDILEEGLRRGWIV